MKLDAFVNVVVLMYFGKQKRSKGWASISVYTVSDTDGCKETWFSEYSLSNC